jgi:hypothetical protein
LRLVRADGLLAPLALVTALALASAGIVIEALLFRGLLDLGRRLTTPEQRLGMTRLSHKTSAGKVAANVYTERDNQCQLEVTFVPQITVTTSA